MEVVMRRRRPSLTTAIRTLIQFLLFCNIIMLMTACSDEGSVYRIQYPKFSFTPHTFPSGDESGYAEVTFLTPDDNDFPRVVEINGSLYTVAVFNGYSSDEHLADLQSIEVDDCILTINSHAYEKASNVTEMSITNVMGLGTSSLPENLISLTVNANAINTVGTRPLNESLPNPDKLETLVITGTTSYPIDLSGMGGDGSFLTSITIDGNIEWPTMPHPVQEGMKFLGWFTDDPTINPDAEFAEAGKKPSSIPITVHPYFVPGEDVPEEKPDRPVITMPPLNVIKTYVYGLDRERFTFEKDDQGDYTVTVSVDEGWKINWTVNGTPDASTQGPVYHIDTDSIYGRIQVIGYIFNTQGVAVGAVLFELRG